MNTRMLFAGLVFLFNPNYAAFDILPDFIGYFLIYLSLSRLSLLQPTVSEARDGFRSLTFAALGKAGLFILLFIIQSGSAATYDKGYDLALAFGFGFIELWFSYKAFTSFFAGTDGALLRHDAPGDEGARGNALAMSWIFIIAKHALCVAAELPFLWETKITGTVNNVDLISYSNIRHILTLFNFFAVTLLGIVWLVIMRRYVRQFDRPAFKENVRRGYLSLLNEKPALLLRGRLALAYRLMLIGFVCLFSFTVWNVNLLPTFLCGVLCLLALYLLTHTIPDTDGMRAIESPASLTVKGIVFTAVSAVQYALSTAFSSMHSSPDEAQSYADIIYVVIRHERTALVHFILVVLFTVLEAVCLLIFFRGLFALLEELAKKYTRTKYETAQMENRNEEILADIRHRLKISYLWAAALCASLVLQQLLLFVLPIMWFVSMLASVGFLINALKMISTIASETEHRFIYE